MSRDPRDGDPRETTDIEAARLRARMRTALFKKPEEKVQIGRFEIVRRLGAGAMGLVYEAIDPRSGNHLALKTVRTHNPRLLSLFKREFRSLTRVNHPNLVTLYELGRDGNTFFFTMELIRGLSLLRYLWGSEEPPPAPPGALPASPVIDFDRLRAVFAQLAAGVAALHEAGKLHRDIKPTNVMVTAEGRVVLMDFGFVAEHGGGLLESTQGSMIVGTPAFMSPEQSRAERLDAAADWYSVGATLYHALTGHPPYSGMAMAEILLLKETQPPTHPRLLARGVPADLGDLCVELLQPDPASRPSEGELLQRMHATPWGRTASSSGTGSDSRRRTSMIGLGLPLTRLAALYRRGEDTMRVIRVVGSAGHGKSRLVSHFLEILRAQDERPLILRSRCNPSDAVPAHALDALVDGLARQLRLLGEEELRALLPTELSSLVRLFPVLSQVPVLAALSDDSSDGPINRAAGFTALRHILGGLARRRPLVLWIDDLQWSDPEGSARLADLLAPPSPPPLLALLSYRPDDAEQSPALRELFAQIGGDIVEVEALTADEATHLAASLLGERATLAEAAALAEEAERSPLWIHELVRLFESSHRQPTLLELVDRRMAELPPSAADLVALTAVFAEPLPLDLAAAAGASEQAIHSGLRQAIASSLVRLIATPDGDAIAPLDPRIRSALLAKLDGQTLREHHRRLAAALERSGESTPEQLIHHFRGAGELDQAQRYALLHAEQRAIRGNHLGAANLLRLAHELGNEGASGAALLRRLGEALVAAGLELEAADAWLRATVDLADDDEDALGLRIPAARFLLTHGAQEEGQRVLAAALRALAMPALDQPTGTISSLLRASQRWMGLRYRERAAATISQRELLQVDASWAASVGLLQAEPELAAEAQARHLALALKVGEPYRIGRAIALEALRLAAAADLPRAAEHQAMAATLAARVGSPHLRALAELAKGVLAIQQGELGLARAAVDAALAGLRRPLDAGWERLGARLLALHCDLMAGDLGAARPRLAEWLADARAIRSRSGVLLLEALGARLDMASGLRPADAGSLAKLPRSSFDLPTWTLVAARVEAAMLDGSMDAAWSGIDAFIGANRPSGLLGAMAVDLRARVALTAASARHLRLIERDLGILRRHPLPIAATMADAISAALAAERGEDPRALLVRAADAFAEAGLHLRSAASRLRAAAGDEAAEAALGGALRLRGVSVPARMAALFLPWPASKKSAGS